MRRIVANTGLLLSLLAATISGCGETAGGPSDPRTDQTDRQVRQKWGKSLAELPTVTLEIISPHNQDIKNEFAWAFSLHHAVRFGQRVHISWREVGGGASSIQDYVTTVYRKSETAGIDILWGGGEYIFAPLGEAGHLQPMELSEDVLKNIPEQLGGTRMYDPQRRWVGSAVSGFGFMYNKGVLDKCGIEAPQRWEDLCDVRFADLLALADPMQSGSAAAAYRMIVVSEPTWKRGWAKLLRILANAKQFYDSAGTAANAPALGEAPVATCIDFYGIIRVAEAPEELVYFSPPGQTTFSPDPIGILKNPPSPELAQRFVNFVLSRKGQALWALRVGTRDGPIRSVLGRGPIRKDIYTLYADSLSPRIINPYQSGQALRISERMRGVHFGVLRELVAAAAIDNPAGLRAARDKLIETKFDPERLGQFNRLPDDVDTLEKMRTIWREFRDEKSKDRITTNWRRFFREKYRRVRR